MVGDTPVSRSDASRIRVKAESLDDLCDIACERRYARRLLGVDMVLAQHKAVILNRGATARGVDHDAIEAGRQALALPCIDVGASENESGDLLPEMVDEGPATAAAFGHDHFAAMSGQKTDRRFVDF